MESANIGQYIWITSLDSEVITDDKYFLILLRLEAVRCDNNQKK